MIGRLIRAALLPRREPPTGGGLPWGALYPDGATARGLAVKSYQRLRSIAASTDSVQLAAANPARSGLTIVNDGTATLYVALGAFASTSSYSAKVPANGQVALTDEPIYRGDVAGVWDAATGFARITEDT